MIPTMTKIDHSWATSVITRTVSAKLAATFMPRTAIISLRRLTWSATVPANSATKKLGMKYRA